MVETHAHRAGFHVAPADDEHRVDTQLFCVGNLRLERGEGQGEVSNSIHIHETGIHIQSIPVRKRAIATHNRAIRIYIRATATRSREIGIYSREIASYSLEIAADKQEMAVNIEEIAGYARRNAAAAVRPLPAAADGPCGSHFAPVSAQKPFIFPFAASRALNTFRP